MKLERYCEMHGIEARFRDAPGAETAEGAAAALDTTVDHIIKSLVFVADDEPVLVVVSGAHQVDERKLAEVLRTDDIRMADPDEVHEATGYRIGGVPPVGTDLHKIVDDQVLEKDRVYGGGGADDRIIELDPRFIVDEDDLVRDVTV